MRTNALGNFLRARRASLTPDDVGLVSSGVRRVAGLRREEVAVLGGINVDYYTRLEQGRERHPSAQVLDALGRALLLDPEAHDHLCRLAGVSTADAPARRYDIVDPELRRLLEGYTTTPALVLGTALDVLATNAPADALYSPFAAVDNIARMAFLDPAARHFYRPWERTAHAAVANLRRAAGLHPHDARLQELVEDLTTASPEFAALWRTHAVRGKTREPKQFNHPDVGRLTLTYHAFDVRAAPGQQLVVYHAEPDSPSAHALTLLGSLHATRRDETANDR